MVVRCLDILSLKFEKDPLSGCGEIDVLLVAREFSEFKSSHGISQKAPMGSFYFLLHRISQGPYKVMAKRSQRGPVENEKNIQGRGVGEFLAACFVRSYLNFLNWRMLLSDKMAFCWFRTQFCKVCENLTMGS